MELDKQNKVIINRGHRLKVVYEIFMAMLAFVSVIFIWNDHSFIRNLDFVIWLIFVMDVSIRFFSSESKLAYIKRNPLDLVAIIPLDSIFRLARLVRLIRLLRTLAILKHYAQPVYEIFRTNNLDKVLILLVVLIFITSIPITLLEPGIVHYSDAVWWAIVTSTTVGYGDISPVTVVGRLIAIILMVFGIGLLGLVTSSIAAYFSQNKKGKENATVAYLKEQIDHLEELSDEEIEKVKMLIDSYKRNNVL